MRLTGRLLVIASACRRDFVAARDAFALMESSAHLERIAIRV